MRRDSSEHGPWGRRSSDGASSDASAGDGGDTQCTLLGGKYDTTCGTPADCTTVARGCACDVNQCKTFLR